MAGWAAAQDLFSRDAATLYERVSVRWSVRPLVCRRSVTLLHFGLLGATYGRVSGLVYRRHAISNPEALTNCGMGLVGAHVEGDSMAMADEGADV